MGTRIIKKTHIIHILSIYPLSIYPLSIIQKQLLYHDSLFINKADPSNKYNSQIDC